MFHDYFTKNLKEDEQVIKLVRIYALAMIHHILISLFVILLSFFLMFLLFKQGTWGVILFIILLMVGLLYGLRQWIIWALNAFVITNKRIIDFDQKGFFNKTVSECSLDKIQDVSYAVVGPWQTMFNYGSVKLQTAGSKPTLEISRVYKPQALQELITETMRRFSAGEFVEKKEEEMSASEMLAILRQIRSEIGEEEFQKIIKRKKLTKE